MIFSYYKGEHESRTSVLRCLRGSNIEEFVTGSLSLVVIENKASMSVSCIAFWVCLPRVHKEKTIKTIKTVRRVLACRRRRHINIYVPIMRGGVQKRGR